MDLWMSWLVAVSHWSPLKCWSEYAAALLSWPNTVCWWFLGNCVCQCSGAGGGGGAICLDKPWIYQLDDRLYQNVCYSSSKPPRFSGVFFPEFALISIRPIHIEKMLPNMTSWNDSRWIRFPCFIWTFKWYSRCRLRRPGLTQCNTLYTHGQKIFE